jgi:hypothetical protein
MCGADKICITELTLIHKNIRSVPNLHAQKLTLKGKLLSEPVSEDVVAYVRQCIDLVWYMCIQQPPMEIMWAKLHNVSFDTW